MLLSDLEYLPLSYLSQADYCLRRAGLLLNERVWMENSDTAKGRKEHEKVHAQRMERRGSEAKLFEYPVFSNILGISGKCDLLEARQSPCGCKIPALEFPVCLYPVEYKHGKLREEREYEIQLCAQAICLEEMYHTSIPEGAIFYISSHRRKTVVFTEDLRRMVFGTAKELHRLRETLFVPAAEQSDRCRRCSLLEYCMPGTPKSAGKYCEGLAKEAKEVQTV